MSHFQAVRNHSAHVIGEKRRALADGTSLDQLFTDHENESRDPQLDTAPRSTLSSFAFLFFLDASAHLYKKVCPSVRLSVRNAFVSNTRKRVISASEVEGTSAPQA